jgi:hypothetical protein
MTCVLSTTLMHDVWTGRTSDDYDVHREHMLNGLSPSWCLYCSDWRHHIARREAMAAYRCE